MIEISERQRDNLVEAKRMWGTISDENVSPDLRLWRFSEQDNPLNASLDASLDVPPTCDTIACFGGWCAWNDVFREQGLRGSRSGAPYFEGLNLESVSQKFFGVPSMFNPRGSNDNIDVLPYGKFTEYCSDWQVVMNRIDALLNSSIVDHWLYRKD